MYRSLVIALLAALTLLPACKRRHKPPYDVTTPEATVSSLFEAMNKKRVPQDLRHLMSTTALLRQWEFRCRKGCFKATHKIVRREQVNPSKVIVYVDYVFKVGDGRRLRGKAQPFVVDKLVDQWLVGEIGVSVTSKSGPKSPSPAPDAGS